MAATNNERLYQAARGVRGKKVMYGPLRARTTSPEFSCPDQDYVLTQRATWNCASDNNK
jgi:hypothetical protein